MTELKKNKCLSDAHESTSIRMMQTVKALGDLKIEFNKEIDTLKRTQAKMTVELEKSKNRTIKIKGKIEWIKQRVKYWESEKKERDETSKD